MLRSLFASTYKRHSKEHDNSSDQRRKYERPFVFPRIDIRDPIQYSSHVSRRALF